MRELVKGVPDWIRTGGRIIQNEVPIWSELASPGQKVAKKHRLARKFPHELVMRKPSERPTVYGSGCEGVPEAKRLAG